MQNTERSNNRKISWRIAKKLSAAAIAIMLLCTGCAGSAAADTADAVTENTGTVQVSNAASKSEQFTERDLSGDYDEKEAVKITLSGSSASAESGASGVTIDGSTITISAEGTYIFSGSLTDGQVIVDADDTAKVQIVLDGAGITSSSSAALYVKSADKVFVTTASGSENTLANGGTFTAIDDSNIDGAVFAKDDITFNGSGSLTVTSPAGHGIVGKDDVKIAGGSLAITAAKHGVQANDSARFAAADVTIEAGTDGVHVSDNADEETGTASDSYFYIADGDIRINAGDDGIHADAQALVEGGSITVSSSYEGLEALEITVSGGDIDVTATDDGFNAAGGNSSSSDSNAFGDDDWMGGKGGFPDGGGFSNGGSDGNISISGGSIRITAGGDGVDSNGSVDISGGTTVVQGPSQGDTSILDHNGSASISGGTFIGTGGTGMGENFTSVENQGLITVSTGSQSAGTTVTLTDADGNVIAEITPELDFTTVYISTEDMDPSGTYTLSAGSYSETLQLTDGVYSSMSGGGSGMRGGQERSGNEEMPGGPEAGHSGMRHGGDMSGGEAPDMMQN